VLVVRAAGPAPSIMIVSHVYFPITIICNLYKSYSLAVMFSVLYTLNCSSAPRPALLLYVRAHGNLISYKYIIYIYIFNL